MDTTKTHPVDEALAAIPQDNVGNNVRASWPFSLDNIQQSISRYDPRAKLAMISCFLWCIDPMHPLTKPDFAVRIGSSDNTIYKLFTGSYRWPKVIIEKDNLGKEISRKPHPKADQQIQPSEKLVDAMEKFLKLEKERFEMGETQLVETPTLRSIVTLCDLTRTSRTIGTIQGPSHIGKTWTLERYYTPRNNHGRTIYTRMEAASGLGGMVRCMARSLGISDKGNTTELVGRIKNAVTQDMLWLLDEMSLLAHTYRAGSFFNCIEVIREIHDVKKMPMVWCFTDIKNFEDASRKELQQAWRRGVHKLKLPDMPTIGDLTAIFNHNGLEFPAEDLKAVVYYLDDAKKRQSITEHPRAIVRQVAKEHGLLAITERLSHASYLAKKSKRRLDWNIFTEAHLIIAKQAEPKPDWN